MKTLKENSTPSSAGPSRAETRAESTHRPRVRVTDDPRGSFYLIRTKRGNLTCCRGKRLLLFESGTSCNSSTTHDADRFRSTSLSTTDAEKGLCVCVCVCVFGVYVCVCVCVCVCIRVCYLNWSFFLKNKVIWAKISRFPPGTRLRCTQLKLFL